VAELWPKPTPQSFCRGKKFVWVCGFWKVDICATFVTIKPVGNLRTNSRHNDANTGVRTPDASRQTNAVLTRKVEIKDIKIGIHARLGLIDLFGAA
jgi:hypothetical protein